MKAKYQSVLDLGQELEIQNGNVNEENGVLHVSGTAKNQYEKNLGYFLYKHRLFLASKLQQTYRQLSLFLTDNQLVHRPSEV